LDKGLGEFWVTNPWHIVGSGHNLSAFERNRVYLNSRGEGFLDISHLTGADSDGDGRAVVAADFRGSGKLDLIVRQSGGGALLLFENQMPRRSYLAVSLRGKGGNRRGIGARLTAVTGSLRQTRELYPACGYFAQTPALVHFGLADADTVDSLTVRWPDGKVQVLKGVKANRHIIIDQQSGAAEEVIPGRRIAP
jgi:hypothetical protein